MTPWRILELASRVGFVSKPPPDVGGYFIERPDLDDLIKFVSLIEKEIQNEDRDRSESKVLDSSHT